ncbi:MAG: hypothetical protein QM617_05000 [Comamonas sp.]
MTPDTKNTGAPVLRALQMAECLAGYAATGATNKELAEQLKCPPPYVTRTADVLIAAGWARKSEDGRFYPTAHFTRLTFRVLADFDRLENQTQDRKRAMTSAY